jgi:hypothetical protein
MRALGDCEIFGDSSWPLLPSSTYTFLHKKEEEKTSMSISQGPCHDICINFHLVFNYNYTSDYTTYKIYNKLYYLKKH